jgi:hypothetical protein
LILDARNRIKIFNENLVSRIGQESQLWEYPNSLTKKMLPSPSPLPQGERIKVRGVLKSSEAKHVVICTVNQM